MTASELAPTEYLPYFKAYIDQLDGDLELIKGLEDGLKTSLAYYKSIPHSKLEYAYADSKWNIKEIINHLIDSERVFCYRALRFAREDQTAVAGFDENDYVPASKANKRSLESLLEEYAAVRQASILLYKSLDKDMLLSRGMAGEGLVSVRALGFLTIGHEKHHRQIISERYL